ncbi:MAG: nickel pincer cofactor biosynthesis protein LarB [Candidatus Omnitrophica bacterium]|nr:nickel pincer cofactor biosynthesis protein LarB [Candidatus Omnitrophota bacterium]
MAERVKGILQDLEKGHISVPKALGLLKDFPYEDMGFAKVDNHRSLRRGFPEVIFGEGKTPEQIIKIAKRIIAHDGILLATRVGQDVYRALKKQCPGVKYEPKARAIYFRRSAPPRKTGTVAVITAGTADLPVAEEARVTLELMGNDVEMLCDVGVAGLHRILDNKDVLEKAGVIIVIAGMEGALASVVSGLVSKPVIAVPTSVGYGASFGGLAALLAMMNSCSPGVSVVNIDNGFGAGYFASLINT